MSSYPDLNQGQQSLLEHLKQKAETLGGRKAVADTQAQIAKELGRAERTIYRQVNALVEKGYIEKATRRGEVGGTVFVFNENKVSFEDDVIYFHRDKMNYTSHPDNPITGDTPTAEELRDKLFPNKGTYVKDTRTPEQKARDEVLKKRARDENARVNLELARLPHPTTDIFEMTEEPKANFRAYMLSRLYNTLLVANIETWREQVYQEGNEEAKKIADKYYNRFYHYDVLQKEFMGTQAFRDFRRLDDLLQEEGHDPIEYMSVSFINMMDLIKNGMNGNPPYTNILYGPQMAQRFHELQSWKLSFEESHPYYTDTTATTRMDLKRLPIMELIKTAYENPLQPIYDPEETIKLRQANTKTPTKEQQVLDTYLEDLTSQINESDLEEDVKENTSRFIHQALVGYYRNLTIHEHLLYNFNNIRNGEDLLMLEEGSQDYYIYIGNWTKEDVNTPEQAYAAFNRGRNLYFSIYGSYTFSRAMRVIRESGQAAIHQPKAREGIKYLNGAVPLDNLGNIDVEQILDDVLTEEERATEHPLKAYFEELIENTQEELKDYYEEEQLEFITEDRRFNLDKLSLV